MGKTAIEWTATVRADGTVAPGYTFNPWRGCSKISEGCKNCYAETLSGRNPGTLGVWGPNGTRVVASEAMWREPFRWDKAAAKAGERHRVFCASLADVFEDWQGPMANAKGEKLYDVGDDSWTAAEAVNRRAYPGFDQNNDTFAVTMQDVRKRLFRLIDQTPHLDWLLLTKRPENVARMMPQYFAYTPQAATGVVVTPTAFRPNVWLGTSVENQQAADERIPHLLRVPAAVRFLSCEPLIGPVDLSRFLPIYRSRGGDGTAGGPWYRSSSFPSVGWPSWVIVGGESGPGARPMHPLWATSIRDQCRAAGVPFFFKQWGEWAPLCEPFVYTPAFGSGNAEYARALNGFARQHGASKLLDDRPEGWGAAMVRDGTCVLDGGLAIGNVGKKAAGRLLDGRTWDEFPEVKRGE